MHINDQIIRSQIDGDIVDYQTLINLFKNYASPRDKISRVIKNDLFIRIKQGLYIFGPDNARRPISKELLANLIHGPSYISLQYALSYYGLIPEKVETITSVTTGVSRTYSTPVGRFGYYKIPLTAYSIGIQYKELTDGYSFLIASPEKALCDLIRRNRGLGQLSQKDMKEWLIYDQRISLQDLESFDQDSVDEIAGQYKSVNMRTFAKILTAMDRRK